MRLCILLFLPLWLLCRVPGSRAQLVINEILPDPAGSDAGREFVEFYNCGPGTVSLAGISFQFANGAEDPDWQTRWTGALGDSLPPGALFLLADHNWLGDAVPDAVCRLGLQNGPDAVRLVEGTTVVDLVGYGPLTEEPFYEGNPASLTPGMALARKPDGHDTDNNAADFLAVVPTPGRPNFRDYQVIPTSWSCDPPSADRTGGEHHIKATLVNTGLRDLTAGRVFLDFDRSLHEADIADFAADHQVNLQWTVIPRRHGRLPLAVVCPVPETDDSLVVALGFLQVGPAALVLNEVEPAPASGQGEWIELLNISDRPLDLGVFQMRDEDGTWRRLPSYLLLPDDPVVVCQDPPALRAWSVANADHGDPSLDPCPDGPDRILDWGSWPSLNNSPPVTREYADRVYLADSTGTVIDHLTFGGAGPDRVPLPSGGRSLARVCPVPVDPLAANWEPCPLGAGGSPGCPNGFPPPGTSAGGMDVSTRVLDRQAGPAAVGVTLVIRDPGRGFRLRVFNLWGENVRELGGDESGPGSRLRYWTGDDDDGRPVPAGGYILVGDVTGKGGVVLERIRVLVGVR